MKRNYEGLSNWTKSEKADFLNLKKQNALYEKEIKALRANNEELAAREQEYRDELKKYFESNNQLKESIEEIKHQSRRLAEDHRREK